MFTDKLKESINAIKEIFIEAKNLPKRFKVYDLTNQVKDHFHEQKQAFEWIRGRAFHYHAKDLFVADLTNGTITEIHLV